MTKICRAGVTGGTGKAIAAGILDAADLALTGALARKAAGIDVGDVLGREPVGVTITADLGAALDGAEVLIDYTHPDAVKRSEEHTSELQSLMRTSYAVFCLKKKNTTTHSTPE